MDATDAASPVKADENGWAEGKIEPLAIERVWSLFSPEADCRIDLERWAHHAQRFFALRIGIAPEKAYPSGASPLVDAFDFEVLGAARRDADPRVGSPALGVGSPALGVGSPALGVGSPDPRVGSPDLGVGGVDRRRVRVITVPLDRAPHARAAALAIARGPTGGGFEALILRAKRLWQIGVPADAKAGARPAIAAATVLASVLLAPILPPGEAVLFGVKTARERLERAQQGT